MCDSFLPHNLPDLLRSSYCGLQLTSELLSACADGDAVGVEHLLEDDDLELDLSQALLAAAAAGHANVAALLLARGAELNSVDTDGRTAFWHACARGHDAVAALLLDFGAAAVAADTAAPSALASAVAAGHAGVVALLLDRAAAGASTAAAALRDMVGKELVAYAAEIDESEIANALARFLDGTWAEDAAMADSTQNQQQPRGLECGAPTCTSAAEATNAGANADAAVAAGRVSPNAGAADEAEYDERGMHRSGYPVWLDVPEWLGSEGGPRGVVTDAIIEEVKQTQ